MDDLDDQLLALAGGDNAPKEKKRKRATKKTYDSDSDESGIFDDASEEDGEASSEEDEEDAEARTWKADLMGDAEDRRVLNAMTELERETILAERRRRLDMLQERRELKARIGQKVGRPDRRRVPKDEKKNLELDRLKKKRQSKARKQAYEEDDEDEESDRDRFKDKDESDFYEDDDEDYARPDKKEKDAPTEARHEDIIKIQLKRTDLERWINTPFFEKTVKGCFVRMAIGMDPVTKKQIYRVALVAGTKKYHRSYRFGKHVIDSALHVLHGKASKDFLMDLTSNGSITEDEWARYVKTMTFEKQTMLKTDHVKRKIEDIKKAKEHIFTNEEISEMIEKKKAFSKMPQNAALEKMRLQAELGAAVDCGDNTKAQEFQEKLDDLEQKVKDATSTDEKLEQFKNVNAKNRDINFFEGREAERAAQMAKKEKGDRDYDPFARRKTAPKHVINKLDEEKEKSLLKVPQSTSPGKTSLKADISPNLKAAIGTIVDEDDFLDSIDISELEADLKA